jgi:hypothetical protein
VGSGERAIVSSSSIFFTASGGFVMRSPEASSLIMERSMGSVLVFGFPATVWRMDLRAMFGFLANIRSRNLPYLKRRTLRVCLRRSLIAFRRLLQHAYMAREGGVSPLG